jgi:hypothetical protein
MAFISVNGSILAFADYQDVVDTDSRLVEANEGLTEDVVEAATIRSTQRILLLLKASDWWRDFNAALQPGMLFDSVSNLPNLDPSRIVARQADFTELTVYYALWHYILPKVADFSKEEHNERAKIGFYQDKYNILFQEILNSGDWYDFNGDGLIAIPEYKPGHQNLVRIR